MAFVLQSSLMLASFVFLFVFREANLTQFSPHLIGILIFIFIVLSAGKKGKLNLGGPASVFILNTIIFLVIFGSGGLSSSFFFVLYFLIFAIAFVFDPALAFVFAAGSLIVFLPESLKTNTLENFVKIGSLFIISPLAYFFGQMFKKQDKIEDEVVKTKERAQEAADTISKDVGDVIEKEKQTLKSEDVEKLNEVLEETEDLRAEKKKSEN